MSELEDGSIHLVLTSPPYFSDECEALLKQPVRNQASSDIVRKQLHVFAASLSANFREISRVAHPGGLFVLQTKDIRYARTLLPLASIHRQLAESAGFELLDRIFHRRTVDRRSRSVQFKRSRRALDLKVDDLEEFLIFRKPGPVRVSERRVDVELAALSSEPVWTLPSEGNHRTHPHQSPAKVVERLIYLLSEPGDTVLDPFAGHGTTLKISVALGRAAVGYEIDPDRFDRCVEILEEYTNQSPPKPNGR